MGSPVSAPEALFPNEKRNSLDSIGRWVRGRGIVFLNLSALLYMAFRELLTERKKGFSLVFEITLRQVYFTGVQALRVVAVISLALGTVIIVQIGTQLSFLGGGIEFIVPILVLILFRELGPLLTAIIVIGRSGTAIATELGNIVIAHELEAIEVMGINPVYFIVTPRIIGVSVAVVCLTIIFVTVGLLGGFWVSKLILPITFDAFLRELEVALSAADLLAGFLKSLIFGVLIALTCTYYGLTVRYSSIEVPQAATRGVVSAMMFCFATNALLTVLFYL
jgi:phospholipid/cholesterol/gamma-HCH transport system permease protein